MQEKQGERRKVSTRARENVCAREGQSDSARAKESPRETDRARACAHELLGSALVEPASECLDVAASVSQTHICHDNGVWVLV